MGLPFSELVLTCSSLLPRSVSSKVVSFLTFLYIKKKVKQLSGTEKPARSRVWNILYGREKLKYHDLEGFGYGASDRPILLVTHCNLFCANVARTAGFTERQFNEILVALQKHKVLVETKDAACYYSVGVSFLILHANKIQNGCVVNDFLLLRRPLSPWRIG